MMKSVVFCSSKIAILRAWKQALGNYDVFVAKGQEHLLTHLKTLNTPIVVLLEKRLYDEDIEGFLSLLQENFPLAKVCLMSHKPSFEEGRPLLSLGIQGYGNIHMSPVHVKDAVETIEDGNLWLYPEFVHNMVQMMVKSERVPTHPVSSMMERLSLREQEVATLVCEGLSNKEIAQRTSITERTVKAHLSSIFEKVGVKDRIALVLTLKTD